VIANESIRENVREFVIRNRVLECRCCLAGEEKRQNKGRGKKQGIKEIIVRNEQIIIEQI